MQNVREKVAYLKGLAEGLQIDKNTNDGKLMYAIIDTLDSMAEAVDTVQKDQEDLEQYVDAIDEDLSDVENDMYGDEDEEEDNEDKDNDDDNYIEMECPNCHEIVYIDRDLIDEDSDEVLCPNCNKPIKIVWEDGCDCGCDDCTHNE